MKQLGERRINALTQHHQVLDQICSSNAINTIAGSENDTWLVCKVLPDNYSVPPSD